MQKMMQQRVSPGIVIAAFVVALILVALYGKRELAEKPWAVGFITVNGVTREMTQAEGNAMGLAMQGKAPMPAGIGQAGNQPTPAKAPGQR